MKKNQSLTLVKCIACAGVVFSHFPFPGAFGTVVKGTALFAVPFFYMIAGYFAYACDEKKIWKRFRKIFCLFLFGYVLFFAYNLRFAIRSGTAVSWLCANFNLQTPIKLLIFCTVDWAIPLWYLIAMAETYLFWILLLHFKKENLAVKFTWFLFLGGTAFSVICCSLPEVPWMYQINFLFRAMPWFLLGYVIRDKEKQIHISKTILSLIILLGFAVTVSSDLLPITMDYTFIGVLLSAPAIFIFCIRYPLQKLPKVFYVFGEKLSGFVYVLHSVFASQVAWGCSVLKIRNLPGYDWFFPILVLVGTGVFVWMFTVVLEKSKNALSKKHSVK